MLRYDTFAAAGDITANTTMHRATMAGGDSTTNGGDDLPPDGSDATILQELVSLYVGQLLHGCQQQGCTEVLCYTGRLHTSHRPVRKYTPRSARAIALGLVSGPQPRAHLCKYFSSSTPETEASVNNDSPRDPSSTIQLLCDTEEVKRLSDTSVTIPLSRELLELKQMHEQLTGFLQFAGHLPRSAVKIAASNDQLAGETFPSISWLLTKLPLQRSAPWILVNREYIGRGLAYPQSFENTHTDGTCNTWLSILDILSHEPYLRLLARMIRVIAVRIVVHRSLVATKHERAPLNKFTHFHEAQMSVVTGIVTRLSAVADESRIQVLAVLVWLKKLLAKHWDGKPVIKYGSICHGALELLSCLFENEVLRSEPKLSHESFEIPFIASTVSMVEMSHSHLEWRNHGDHDSGAHLLNWNWIFSPEQMIKFFRTSNHLTMRAAHSKVEKALMLWRRNQAIFPSINAPRSAQFHHAEQHYLLLNVSRDDILKDTFDQLWQRRKDELRRPLRVRLGETNELEIGHDLGGVQIEFFNLVCRSIFSEETQMFATDSVTGYSYFRPGSLQPLYMFEMFGVLLALALYNGITLPISMPLVFYRLLLDTPFGRIMSMPSPDQVTDGWPILARSLLEVMKEDVPGLDFSFPIEANGIRLAVTWRSDHTHMRNDFNTWVMHAVSATDVLDGKDVDVASIAESWPGWHIVRADSQAPEVTLGNRADYVTTYVRHLIFTSVAPQWAAFYKGFHESSIIGQGALSPLAPQVLKGFIEGTSHLDINELKTTARYDGYDPKSRYIYWFWKIVIGWSETKQKQLLKFVTAAERIPVSGASNLTFIIQKSTPESSDSLPTSSTCFGTLMLPRYPNAEVLAAKLSLALKYGTEGFGTG